MDISRLAAQWRRDAAHQRSVQLAELLERCAEELELAYHQDRHDAEFYDGCRFCDWELEHQQDYPEGG